MSASGQTVRWFRQCNIPETTKIDFFGPDIGIEALTPVLVEHQSVGVIDNGAQAIVDEIASDSEAQGQSDQGDNGDPFLPRVLVSLPRMVDLALLDASRAEVFLVLLLMMKVNGGRVDGSAQRRRVEGIPRSLVDVVTASVT